jgi:hypothetical protein
LYAPYHHPTTFNLSSLKPDMLKKAFQIIFSVLSNVLIFLGGQAKKLNLKKIKPFPIAGTYDEAKFRNKK